MSDFNLNIHTHRLLSDEPFFAALSRRLDKCASTSVPTAGVRVTEDGRFEMVYNPEFMAKLVDECGKTKENATNPFRWVRGVLMHEFYHLVYGHVTTRLPEGGLTRRWNIATDLAINSHIPDELPPLACIPGRGPFEEFDTGLTSEAYYKLLESEGDDEGGGDGEGDGQGEGGQGKGEPGEGNGGGSMDDHSGWETDGSAEDGVAREIAKERLKDMMKKAAHEAGSRGWGSVPADMRQRIIDSFTTKVDWRKVLQNFVKASQKTAHRSTVKRINRRYPYIHAGRRADRTARVAISIDQSGSVSNGMLVAFFAELEQLAKYAEFVVVPFDTRVDENLVHTWKKGEKKQWERVMCGGTDFNAPTRYVNEHTFDGHIILTDMYAEKPIPSKCKRMWMTDASGAKQPYFKTHEKVLEIII